MTATERSPVQKGKVFTWEGESGVQVYSIAGNYNEGLIDQPFSGYFYRQESSRRIFGRLIDPNGSANVMGRMRNGNLFFIKLYDPKAEQRFTQIPIFYRLTSIDGNDWSGSYRIQRTPNVKSEVECRVNELDIPAPELTFVHDDPLERSEYDNVFFDMRERLGKRETEIFRYHPEKRRGFTRGRAGPNSAPLLQF